MLRLLTAVLKGQPLDPLLAPVTKAEQKQIRFAVERLHSALQKQTKPISRKRKSETTKKEGPLVIGRPYRAVRSFKRGLSR
jgi:hypothetical protein